MDAGTQRSRSDDLHAAYMERSIEELQRMVMKHEEAFNEASIAPIGGRQFFR